jgi:hypothetical protein
MPLRRIALSLLALAVLAAPATAQGAAGEVAVRAFMESDGAIREDIYTKRFRLVYKGSAGRASDLTVRFEGRPPRRRAILSDPGGVRAGKGCTGLGPRRASCRLRGRLPAFGGAARFVLGGGDDVLRLRGRGGGNGTEVRGGRGDDRVAGSDGSDVVDPGRGDDRVAAGRGADRLLTGARADGADDLAGGPGGDALSYTERSAGVNADLDGEADDGEAGEGDRIRPDVELLTGGRGADVLEGDGRANVLHGGPWGGADVLSGGEGDDLLRVRSAGSALDGGGGDDVLTADEPARFDGGPGHDVMNAGTAGATMAADDGESDEVRCGDPAGASAVADALDVVLGCGPVTRSGPAAPRFVYGLGGMGETLRAFVARRLAWEYYGSRLQARVGCSSDMPAPCTVRVTIRDEDGPVLDRTRVIQPNSMVLVTRRIGSERRRRASLYTLRLEGTDAAGAPVVVEERDVPADRPVPLTWQG